MAKFKKKPVVINAIQYIIGESIPEGVCTGKCHLGDVHEPHTHTLKGVLYVTDKDWIITGIKGEIYPCKPDIFETTYDAVVEIPNPASNIVSETSNLIKPVPVRLGVKK